MLATKHIKIQIQASTSFRSEEKHRHQTKQLRNSSEEHATFCTDIGAQHVVSNGWVRQLNPTVKTGGAQSTILCSEVEELQALW